MSPSSNQRLTAWAALGTTSVCWAMNTVFSLLAVGRVSPMLLVALRWVVVVVVVLAVAWPHLRRDWPVLRNHLPWLGAMGALGFTSFNALFYLAAHWTIALNIAILQGAIPAFVALGGVLLMGERVGAPRALGVSLTLLGAVLVATRGQLGDLFSMGEGGLGLNIGDALMLLACLLYAGYTIALQRRPAVSGLSMFTVFAVAALLAAVPLALIEAALGRTTWPTSEGWLLIIAIALLPSLLAQLLFIRGVAIIGPTRAGLFVNLVPVFAAAMAVGVLGEQLRGYHFAALGLVLAGIYLSERGTRRA